MPSPYRTEPCGSTSTSSVFTPRRAIATARLIAVVVFPTPPFWLTIASTRPTLRLWFLGDSVGARAQLFERHFRVPHPTFRLGARRRLREKCFQVFFRRRAIIPLEQRKCEPVMRSRPPWRDLQRTPLAADRVVQPPRLRESDGHILPNLRIIGAIAQRQTIRSQGGLKLSLSRQC